MEVKNRIKVVLVEKEKLAKDLSAHLGISKNSISRWCNNLQQPTLSNLYKTAAWLGVNVCELLDNTEPPTKENKESQEKESQKEN